MSIVSDTEVGIMEDGVLVHDGVLGWDFVDFLLDVNMYSWVLNDEWHLLADGVLFEFVNGEVTLDGDFVWNLNLGGVVLPELNDEWLINGNLEWNLVPLGLRELLLLVVWLLLVLCHWDLEGFDVWDLLDHGVVNSLGDFVWDSEFFFEGHLVVDSVWDLLCDNIWDLVDDGVGNLTAGDVRDLEFNLEWDLPFNSVGDFDGDFIWLKGLNFVFLSHVGGVSDLVWDLGDLNIWDLLGDLVLLGHIGGLGLVVEVIG